MEGATEADGVFEGAVVGLGEADGVTEGAVWMVLSSALLKW